MNITVKSVSLLCVCGTMFFFFFLLQLSDNILKIISSFYNQSHMSLIFSAGHVETVTFVQSSSQIVNEGSKELEIHCSHDGSSLTVMLWYQHKQSSRSVSLIGYTVLHSEPQNEDQFKQRFLLKRENMTQGSLIIHTVNASDSAVYYCAASAQ